MGPGCLRDHRGESLAALLPKRLTRRALSRRVIMLAGACLARSGLARRALDTNFSLNLGWYFEYFSKSENSKQLVPARNLYF